MMFVQGGIFKSKHIKNVNILTLLSSNIYDTFFLLIPACVCLPAKLVANALENSNRTVFDAV